MPRECECGDQCPPCEGCGKPQCECICDEGLFSEEDGDFLDTENPPDDTSSEEEELGNNDW